MQRGPALHLSVTVFAAGAVVLVLEILGARVLAPFLGSSSYVWSALISVTLLSLAVGYRWGGALADRGEPLVWLSRLLVAAGWLVVLVPYARRWVLPAAWGLGIRTGALAAAAALFAPALILLGTVAPLAAKGAVADLGTLGGRVGGLYALSTVGSLAGALLAGYVLIPVAGVTRIFLGAALALFLPALAFREGGGPGRRWRRAAAVAGTLAALAGILRHDTLPAGKPGDGWTMLDREDSRYGEIKVVQYNTVRILLLDGTLQTGVELTSGASSFPYAAAVPALLFGARPDARRILVVGLGGGAICEAFADAGARVDAVEIDPAVAGVARRFFLRRSDPAIMLEDGRTFLRRTAPGTYDAIFLDAYAGEAPPAHLFTREALGLLKTALAPGGIGVANLIAFPSGPRARLARCVGVTLKSVFPWVEARAVEKGDGVMNVIYLFGDRPRRLDRLAPVRVHPQVAPYLAGLLARQVNLDGPDAFVLTDEFAPVEAMNLAAREATRYNMRAIFGPVTWLLL